MRSQPDTLLPNSLNLLAGVKDAAALPSSAHLQPPLIFRRSASSVSGIGNAGNIVDLVICLLSFFGSLFIILPPLLSRGSRKLRHSLIVGLAASDLTSSVVVIICTSCLLAGLDLGDQDGFCGFLGYMQTVSVFTQHCWNMSIALVTYMILVHPLSSFTLTVERRLVWLWPLFWGSAFAVNAFAFIWANYGYEGGYCTLTSPGKGAAIFLFVPRAVVFVIIIVLYTHLFFFLRRTNLFKAASRFSGSRRQANSRNSRASRRNAVSPAEAGAGAVDSRYKAVEGDGATFSTAPYDANASSNSSTTEHVSGSGSSKRSFRARFLSAVSFRPASMDKAEELEMIPDSEEPCVMARRKTTRKARPIEPQQEPQQRDQHAQWTDHSAPTAEHVTADPYEGKSAGVAQEIRVVIDDANYDIDSGKDVTGMAQKHVGPVLGSGEGLFPISGAFPIVLVDASTPQELTSQAFLSSVQRARSRSDPPGIGQAPAFNLSSGGGGPIGSHANATLEGGESPLDVSSQLSAAAPVPAVAKSIPGHRLASRPAFLTRQSSGEASIATLRSDARSVHSGKTASKRPATTETYGFRGQSTTSRIKNGDDGPGRVGSSSHTYRVGGKTGARMLRRRASLGDCSDSSDSDEDLYSFRPMRPRKDVNDFDMISAPREHLKHLNAPKIWANMAEMLALGGDGSEAQPQADAASGARHGDDPDGPVHGSVVVPMPPTEKEFERTLGDDWSWGMDVTSPPRSHRHHGGKGSDADRKGTAGSKALARLVEGYGGQRHGSTSNGGQTQSSRSSGSNSSDGQGVESLGSTLNRQASLLMLLYPMAYVLLFSVSIIRIIDDLANDPPRSSSQEVLHSLSRWFIFAQGLLDAIIFQIVEKQFRKRMKRRRKRAMGEAVEDPFWTQIYDRTMRGVRRAFVRDKQQMAEVEEEVFRHGHGSHAPTRA